MKFRKFLFVVAIMALTAFTGQPPKKTKLQVKVESLAEKVEPRWAWLKCLPR